MCVCCEVCDLLSEMSIYLYTWYSLQNMPVALHMYMYGSSLYCVRIQRDESTLVNCTTRLERVRTYDLTSTHASHYNRQHT